MSVSDVKKGAETKMQKSVENLRAELSKIRTGRVHPGILDQVEVDYYGTPTPVSQVANISVLDARTLGVQVWEKKIAGLVEKAIRESDLGLNPQAMGEVIRVPMPPLTEERRKELTKVARTEGENTKVAVRNLRRDANEQLKKLLKDKDISEDDERRAQDDIQKITDKAVTEIDKCIAEKEKEIMTI